MTNTIRLTMAQALAKFLTRQKTVIDGKTVPLFGGVFAIFGHGNVAGMGEALYQVRSELPTYRAHNEQGMAHAAIAFAKASFRRRMMAVTSSIGPGATNMVTAAALAHVNRLPLLLLPGDVFANRAPDPVLQQVEPDLRVGNQRHGAMLVRIERLHIEPNNRHVAGLEQRPRSSGEILQPRANGENQIGLLGEKVRCR